MEIDLKKRKTTLKSYSEINKSIAYYERNKDSNKLARCYYVKGISMLYDNKIKEGLFWLKKAEEQASETEDAVLLHYIYSNLSYVNHVSGNFNYALSYSKKALLYAKKAERKDQIGYSYNTTASAFQYLGVADSTLFYSNKALYYVNYINDTSLRTLVLNNASIIYGQTGNTTKAKELLKQSLALRPNANAYGNLAQTYSEEGKDDSASLLWAKALKTDILRQKISFMKSYARWLKRNGKYEEASATAIKVAELKDTLIQQQQAEAIKDFQDKYDRKVKENESQRKIIIVLSIAIVMLVIAMVLAWKYMMTWRSEQQAKKEIADNRIMIADYTNQISKMKNSGKEKSTEKKTADKTGRIAGKADRDTIQRQNTI